MLKYLEESGSINWSPLVQWQYRRERGEWTEVEPALATHLEAGYTQPANSHVFVANFTTFQIDYEESRLLNTSTQAVFETRRLAFAPLFPMKVTLCCVCVGARGLCACVGVTTCPLCRPSAITAPSTMPPPSGFGVYTTEQLSFNKLSRSHWLTQRHSFYCTRDGVMLLPWQPRQHQ